MTADPMGHEEDATEPAPVSEVARERELERVHRELQQQGGAAGEDERPPAKRERDAAIDAATEDVERIVEQARTKGSRAID